MYRVLCVEDEIAFREDVADFLRLQSFDVDEASNGAEALSKIENGTYDIILSDIKMPELDGFGMFHALPKNAPPVVFLSALNDRDTIVQSHEMGCEEFLTKPVNFKVLLAALQNRIKNRLEPSDSAENSDIASATIVSNCIQHVLSKPLLQISEVAYYLSSLPDDAPIARTKPVLEIVKDASNNYLHDIHLLQAGLAIPTSLPEDAARHIQLHTEFLRYIECNVPRLSLTLSSANSKNAMHVWAQPDWIVRGFTELLQATASNPRVGIVGAPQLALSDHGAKAAITYADDEALLAAAPSDYTTLESLMHDSAICEAIAPRMLSLLYLRSVAQAHNGVLRVCYWAKHGIAARLELPTLTPQ